jgi:NAD(P)-dependent dehydrogenase (short-subunit alcohol dehydrogenase family)
MDLGLKGKRAIVTGASRGIGRAIAVALAREGASVAICARGQAGLDEAVASLGASGAQAFGDGVDAREPDALSSWVGSAAERLGGLDILISNISTRVDPRGPNWWQETFEVDFHQHVRAFDAALPALKAGEAPAAIFVSSIASVLTQLPPNEIAYGAMKAALTSFGCQMATVHGPSGVRVNLVAPGPIFFEGGVWDMIRQKQPDLYERASRLSALGRMGTPEEVANAVAFLASPAASYITGVNLRIDGGVIRTANF